MPRIVNEVEYAEKRNEILDVAQRLIYSEGYQQMTIQEILDALQISKGAFYHYFSSKQALLEAMIERMMADIEQVLDPIVLDPDLPALEKLQTFFSSISQFKTARKDYLLALLRAWYADDNAILRQKVETNLLDQAALLLAEIIQQGIREGAFTNPFPDQVAEVVMVLLQSMSEAVARLILAPEPDQHSLDEIENSVAAYTDAIERVLGMPSGSLEFFDSQTLKKWVDLPAEEAVPIGETPVQMPVKKEQTL